MFRCWNCK